MERIERFVEAFDGLKLHTVFDKVDDAKAVLIISHGVGANIQKFQYANLAKTMNEAGYSTYLYDQRGHGESEGERQFINHYTDLFKDVNTIAELAKKDNPGKKVFVFGNSMGSFSVLGFAIDFPNTVDGIILSVIGLGVGGTEPGHDIHERFMLGGPDIQKQIDAGLVKNDIPFMTYGLRYAMNEGGQHIRDHVSEVSIPVLFVNSVEDNLVDWHWGLEMFEAIKIADRQFSVYGGATHELYGSPRREKVLADTKIWLDQHC